MADALEADIPPQSEANELVSRLENYVRQRPGGALPVATGLGLATVLVTRALIPSALRSLSGVLLEDNKSRLTELKQTALDCGTDVLAAYAQLARDANCRQLVLFHHNPESEDATLLRPKFLAREGFPDTMAAREGLSVAIAGVRRHSRNDRLNANMRKVRARFA